MPEKVLDLARFGAIVGSGLGGLVCVVEGLDFSTILWSMALGCGLGIIAGTVISIGDE